MKICRHPQNEGLDGLCMLITCYLVENSRIRKEFLIVNSINLYSLIKSFKLVKYEFLNFGRVLSLLCIARVSFYTVPYS